MPDYGPGYPQRDMVGLIGVPFDLCGKRFGARLGPAAVRLAGIGTVLSQLGQIVEDYGDIALPDEETLIGGIRNFQPARATYQALKAQVTEAIASQHIPLVLGGDHSTAIGSISAALDATEGDLAVLWVDAHADFNTPNTSPSGNLHGMCFGALCGLPSGMTGIQDLQWKSLTEEVVTTRMQAKNIAFLGLRDVDSGEARHMREHGVETTFTMYDVDRMALTRCLDSLDAWIRERKIRNLWISFDVDALDPILAPGTGTAVRGGLTYREMHLLGEMMFEMLSAKDCPYQLLGLDLVETNPLQDVNNVTAITAVEWIASLFGKKILGPTP